jgi:hypothetical protein
LGEVIMTDNELIKPQQRAIQYFFVDGTGELAISIVCLALAFYFWVESAMPGSLLAEFLSGSFALIILASSFILNRLVRAFKQRVTYPRTGYIAYRKEETKHRVIRSIMAAIIAMLVAGLMTYLFLKGDAGAINLMPAISGLAFGLILGLIAWRAAITRYYILSIFSIVSGTLLGFSSLSNMAGLTLYYAVMGVTLLGVGLYTLLTYLRNNPLPHQEAGHDQ